MGIFSKIRQGLGKTRDSIVSGVEGVLKSFSRIDDELFDELEEALILGDIGARASSELIGRLKGRAKAERISDPADLRGLLVSEIELMLEASGGPFALPSPSVLLIIGVNGAGKTTSIGKLAAMYKNEGKKTLIAAADTFRAAAADQLAVWAERAGTPIIRHQEGSDPAAVVFDAVASAKAKGLDLLICDTAGRLQNKKNLMEELRKIVRVIGREWPEAHLETLLIVDATTGQNALNQAEVFKEIADVTGVILTKLDGTAKGGIIVPIVSELKLPVRFVCVGEQLDDLQTFDAKQFAEALFGE